MLRRLLIVAVLCLLAAAFGRPALAANHVLTTAHFAVSYDSDQTQPDFATITQASTVAALAEHALALEESWGYDAPQPAPGGKLVIDILDLSSKPGVIYQWFWSSPVPPASVGIALARSEVDAPDEARTVASAVFMMIEGLYWVPAGYAGGGNDASEDWLLTGPAQWAGFKVTSYGLPGKVGPPEVPVDCHDFDSHFHKCATDGFVSGGDSRWPFYELLAQRFGTAFLKTVWQDAQAGGALAGLGTAIASTGGTLADTMSDYANRETVGGWGIATLDALTPPITGSPISTGAITGPIPSATVSVDHLAARVVELTRGDGSGGHACFSAMLTINVAIPAGTNSRPYIYWTGTNPSATALTVSGSTATATVPWDTCMWSKGVGYLVLPNLSTTLDAANFTVSGSLDVDPTTPATPGADPTPATVGGPVVTVPTADVPPAIEVLSPLLVHVSASSPTLRLIVAANGQGLLHATLGSVDLGTSSLRPGNNDLHFAIPKTLLSALRRSSAAGNVLTLTPAASSGVATGQPVTRRVVVTPAARPKKKNK